MIDADILEKNHLILDEFLISPEEFKKHLSKENKRGPNCIHITTRGIVGSQSYDELQTVLCQTKEMLRDDENAKINGTNQGDR